MRHGIRDERGTALIISLMAMLLLTALGSALIMLTSTETAIATHYRTAQEGLYAADAGAERVVQDLLTVPRWNDVLAGTTQSGFVDTTRTPRPPDGTSINLDKATNSLQAATDAANLWGADNPVWRLYAYSPVAKLLPMGAINSRMYTVVWVADDPADADGNPTNDANGVLTLRAEAYGPFNTHKIIEVTVARTSSVELERGYIAQRGQEPSHRARKAAVQTPGTALTRMQMNTEIGGMTVH